MNAAEALPLLIAALERGEPVVEVVITGSSVREVPVGARSLVLADRVEGTLGDPEVDGRVFAAAAQALGGEQSASHTVETSRGSVSVFLGIHRPADPLVILGAGHIARPLCRVAAMLGYAVTVLDDRSEFATDERFPEATRVMRVDSGDPFRAVKLSDRTHLVLVTRGHRFDFEALRIVMRLPSRPAYIGMVGSQRRVRATLEQLAREGVPVEHLESVHAPIGLDIGAETPEEIAVSIAAELVMLKRGGGGGSLRERSRVVDRWIRSPQ